MWGKGALMALGAALLSLALLAPASAQTPGELTFDITNNSGRTIQIEFYSQDRRGHAWPGGNRAYDIANGDRRALALSCVQGEKICYGAWVKGAARTYWGVGLHGRYGCQACCKQCGQDDFRTTLTP